MRVVSNTSPISNLAIIERLELLRQRYGTVRIPPAVADELSRLSHPAGKLRIQAALAAGWLQVDSSTAATGPLLFPLGAGEAAAISLAMAVKADVLLIDEKRGRAAARHVGLTVAGVLGELLYAKLAGEVVSLRPEIARLRTDAGFFIDSTIERFVLTQAGE
jgi:hypothetical protein